MRKVAPKAKVTPTAKATKVKIPDAAPGLFRTQGSDSTTVVYASSSSDLDSTH